MMMMMMMTMMMMTMMMMMVRENKRNQKKKIIGRNQSNTLKRLYEFDNKLFNWTDKTAYDVYVKVIDN